MSHKSALSPEQIYSVSPTLATYTKTLISDDMWNRPILSKHDRAMITVAALIARQQTMGMKHYFNLAMDLGVSAKEMSEVVLHMAFYAGWSNAFAAVDILKDIFAERGISPDQLPTLEPEMLPMSQALPDNDFFMGLIDQNIRSFVPKLADNSTDVLYHQVWLRPDLNPRDRNLISVTALIAQGLYDFVTVYSLRAKAVGISKEEMQELLAHLAFYAGTPYIVPAIPHVAKAYE
ncbi:carboxymuconolactone decarboxylase family protein [[Mannheimia] succiniciproducens]|uniref:Carboxymuconolactone decarboxylase-like domain-containing protein n=1 Tax=Mannheimia succiniciproducens (strain KCTC 0769BP / MBEL55E) TaxID=221988 RepID=Q65SM9_MANSM|nr:carboxymuconolactone decarboxylase family protein [[Mannheimia] succiniciproducens]AAU38031.1 unknown [[Mannheimia] succiniciproducens MBEL55E]